MLAFLVHSFLGLRCLVMFLRVPFIEPKHDAATMTAQELLTGSESRKTKIVANVEMSKDIDMPETSEVLKNTLDEVNACTMSGPFNIGDLLLMFGRFFNVTRRFGIQQGLKDVGTCR